jgi:hypothetical protein
MVCAIIVCNNWRRQKLASQILIPFHFLTLIGNIYLVQSKTRTIPFALLGHFAKHTKALASLLGLYPTNKKAPKKGL